MLVSAAGAGMATMTPTKAITTAAFLKVFMGLLQQSGISRNG
jgi:hypothetical protein